jgi:hypothetical protein
MSATSPDLRLLAAVEQLMRLFQFNRPNAETLARTVLAAADAATAHAEHNAKRRDPWH